MPLPHMLAPGRSLGPGQVVLSRGAVHSLVLLTLWAPCSGEEQLLLAVTGDAEDIVLVLWARMDPFVLFALS